jgi:hypothetical protein
MASVDSIPHVMPAALRPSHSIAAPLLVAYRGVPSADTVARVVLTAAATMPKVTNMRKHLVGRKAVVAPHIRDVYFRHQPESQTYKLIARCLDVGPEQTPSEAFGAWLWETSFVSFKKGQYPHLIPQDCEQVRLEVTRYRIQSNGIVAAQQLALFRHLFVEGFRARDPDAMVYGGQHDWRPEWWQNPAASPAKS